MEIIDSKNIVGYVRKAAELMAENCDYLVELDQIAGDGDLGVNMKAGFAAMADFADKNEEQDCGKLFMKLGMVLNEAAPSSLGTILSIMLVSGGKEVKGKTQLEQNDVVAFFEKGVEGITLRAKSKPGERTILDSIVPATQALKSAKSLRDGLALAAKAAKDGAERTKNMKAIHGRSAYQPEKLMGHPDGGAVVGELIFSALANNRRI